ncbi:hypothetical protein HLB44_05575 [Aquincola sp. S2]|uniref:Immunity MXAN-0049 protein domain-containing protein n=1 Tax=Pseudaquabacterium terrae TaxID=2732868 RepID=A0ABX2ECS3_9BURK|nr:DUF1629 domain-containing protein [Aquabacterium terrae]NRF66446.1 hypothetical protein [Aquabacterium terrae]
MTAEYVIWKYVSVPHACVLNKLTGLEKQFRLRRGVPLQADFPDDVAFHMHPDFPNDLVLADNVLNINQSNVVSPRLRDFLAGRQLPSVEFLPLKIIDHKGRGAGNYFIVHPVDPIDCIDRSQSVFEESDLVEGAIDSMSRLVIDPARIPAGRPLFKLQAFSDITLVHRDLTAAIDQQGFSGIGWTEIANYPEK